MPSPKAAGWEDDRKARGFQIPVGPKRFALESLKAAGAQQAHN
jgi:hypothetical protein